MKKISATAFSEIRNWIYRNARPLELSIWQYHFENGNKEAILDNLSFYQNDDGGFGNALEADSWNPSSSPYTTLYAAKILKKISFIDTQHPMFQGIIKYFESGVFCNENGWSFTIPSNDDYPRAPWWTYNEKANETESIGLTAEIVSFIFQFVDSNSRLYKKAIDVTKNIITMLSTKDSYGNMGIGGYCVLLETIQQSGLTEIFDVDALMKKTHELVDSSIERDTSKWTLYGVRPSLYIHSPQSAFYQNNKNIVQAELDYLIDTKPENAVWGITWTWYEHNEKYAKEFAVSENWWRAEQAIEKLIFLRNFDRLSSM